MHVARSDGLAGADPANLARQRILVESLGGTYHQVVGDDIPAALLDFARGVNATQLVLGASRRGRLAQLLLGRGVGVTTTARVRRRSTCTWSPTRRSARAGGLPRRAGARSAARRRLAGLGARRGRAAAADRWC